MTAGISIAAQTAQTPGVAGAGTSTGLFGKAGAHLASSAFDTLLAAFFGAQGMAQPGAAAGAALMAAAGKAIVPEADTADAQAKSGDDKAVAADLPAGPDAPVADPASAALLALMAGQAQAVQAPVAQTTMKTEGVQTEDGAAAADAAGDAAQVAGGKSATGAANALKAQTAQLGAADAAAAADIASANSAADMAAQSDAATANLALPAQTAPAARAANRAGQDAAAYAADSAGAQTKTPAPQVPQAAPQAAAAAQTRADAAPPAEAAAVDATLSLESTAPPAPEIEAAAAEAAPQAPLAPQARPAVRAAKAADARKDTSQAAAPPAAAAAAQTTASSPTLTAMNGQGSASDTVEAVDPNLTRDEAPAKIDAKDATSQAPAAPALAAEQATGVSRAAIPVRGSPETVANLAAQIIKKLDGRTTRFDVELNPADLGRVDVRIEIGAHGRVTASMSFENPQAAAELRGRADELQSALEQAGFDMSGGMSFDVAGDRGQARQGQPDASTADGGGQARGRAFQAALDTASGSADAALNSALAYRARPVTGVDIRI